MKTLFKYSKGSRVICILAPLFKMLEATLELIVPLVMASIIDVGIAESNKKYIYKLSAQLVILGIVGLVFSITAQYFASKASVSIVSRIKHAAYEKSQNLSFSQLDKIGTSTLIMRLTSDMDSVQNGINLTLRLLLRSPFVVIGACIMAFKVDTKSAFIFCITVPALSIIIFSIMAITIPLNKKVRAQLDKVLLLTRENLTGIRVIRAFNKQEDTIKKFSDNNNQLTDIQKFTGRITALLNPLTYVTVNLGIVAIIYIGAVRVNTGLITTGAVVALYNYMSQILVELIKLANLIVNITKSVACGSRINALLELPDENVDVIETGTSSNSYIEFKNVSFAYGNNSDYSLTDISFTVNKGEKIGIIGSTGSGKTTLINLLSGSYKPTKGEIYIDGKNVNTIEKNELKQKISIAEQKATIFKGTVKSNLLIGNSKANDDDIIKALQIAQADSFVLANESGIDYETEQNGRNLSGGQRQRISIARAIIKKADILVLDDSFSALDFSTEAKLRKAINDNIHSTEFIISQRSGSIMNCDKIIVLEDGKAEIGTHDELLKSSEVYREIHLSQFEEEVKAV